MTADFKQGTNLLGQILANSQVAGTTDTTVYTVPAQSAVKIASASLCNVTASPITISVYVVPSGQTVAGTRKVVHDYVLAAGDSTVVDEIVGAFLGAGDFIVLKSSAATALNYTITGAVSS